MNSFFLFSLLLSCLAIFTCASQFDPHVPGKAPWFEGWYMRVTADNNQGSYGFVFGSYPQQSLSSPSAYFALLAQPSNKAGASPMVLNAHPDNQGVSIFVGQNQNPVTTNPDFKSPPTFCWIAHDSGSYFCANQNDHALQLNFPDGTRVVANFTQPEPWGPNGEGPEGWVASLDITGLHWFVFSLHSRVSYQITSPSLGLNVRGTGWAHQEKNWGASFPTEWVWAEAVTGVNNTRLALAGGPVKVGPITLTAFLIGYRSNKLTWNFHPQDIGTTFNPSIDACNGRFNMTVSDLTRVLFIEFTTPQGVNAFSKLECPTANGFQVDSVESFTSQVYVRASSRSITGTQVIEEIVMSGAALEFGGGYMCQQ